MRSKNLLRSDGLLASILNNGQQIIIIIISETHHHRHWCKQYIQDIVEYNKVNN
jgi:hypothetical protein